MNKLMLDEILLQDEALAAVLALQVLFFEMLTVVPL